MWRTFQYVSMLLSFLASASLGITVADIVMTSLRPCGFGIDCPRGQFFDLARVFSYIASGIWGSLAVFATGLLGIRLIRDPSNRRAMFVTVCFLTAVVFTPTVVVINVLEAYWVAYVDDRVNVTGDAVVLAMYDPSTGQGNEAKFALPVVVSCLGLVEFFIVSGMLVYVCLKLTVEGSETVDAPVVKPTEPPNPVPQKPTAQPVPAAAQESLPNFGAQDFKGFGYYYPSRIYQLPFRTPALRPGPMTYVPMSDPGSGAVYSVETPSQFYPRTYGARYIH